MEEPVPEDEWPDEDDEEDEQDEAIGPTNEGYYETPRNVSTSYVEIG